MSVHKKTLKTLVFVTNTKNTARKKQTPLSNTTFVLNYTVLEIMACPRCHLFGVPKCFTLLNRI